uniref:Uncharacterized protein n=1 Tax=Solanum lycopersicum TaxID=4081 RepID=A0A3Q7FPB2_SOLLC
MTKIQLQTSAKMTCGIANLSPKLLHLLCLRSNAAKLKNFQNLSKKALVVKMLSLLHRHPHQPRMRRRNQISPSLLQRKPVRCR